MVRVCVRVGLGGGADARAGGGGGRFEPTLTFLVVTIASPQKSRVSVMVTIAVPLTPMPHPPEGAPDAPCVLRRSALMSRVTEAAAAAAAAAAGVAASGAAAAGASAAGAAAAGAAAAGAAAAETAAGFEASALGAPPCCAEAGTFVVAAAGGREGAPLFISAHNASIAEALISASTEALVSASVGFGVSSPSSRSGSAGWTIGCSSSSSLSAMPPWRPPFAFLGLGLARAAGARFLCKEETGRGRR